MRKFVSAALAAVMGASVFATGAMAAPMVERPALSGNAASGDVMQVRDFRDGGRNFRSGNRSFGNRSFGNRSRHFSGDRGFRHYSRNSYHRDNGNRFGYYNGYQGSRYYHRGWRNHNGFFYPGAAFLGGVVVGSLLDRGYDDGYAVRRSSYGNSHVRYCYDRYRSYRAYDNSFQPYNGPRQQCYSPYS